MDERKKTGKKIGKAFLIFWGLMFLGYLISRGIYVVGLPKVTVEVTESRALFHTVEASGILQQEADGGVYVPAGLAVKEVKVHPGDSVEEGTELFTLELPFLQQEAVSDPGDSLEDAYLPSGADSTVDVLQLEQKQMQYLSQNMDVTVKLNSNIQYQKKLTNLMESLAGENGTVRAVYQSEQYRCCFPIDALHQDGNNRYYVYLLEESQGFFGTELVAKKIL